MPKASSSKPSSGIDVSASASTNLRDLQEEFASNIGLDASTYKSLNLANFEQSNALYRSVELGLKRNPTSLETRRHHSDGFLDNAVRFSSTLKRANSDVVQSSTIPPLMWKFNEYPVSKCHGFSSLEASELKDKLENACKLNNVEFQSKGCFGYDCVAFIDSLKVQFRILVSKLQSSCQKAVGDKYVVEVSKGCCDCPFLWNSTTSKLKSVLNRDVRFPCEKQGMVFNDLLQRNTADEKARENERIYALEKDEDSLLLSTFLKSLVEGDISETSIEFASVFASITANGVRKEENKGLVGDDVNNLVYLMRHESDELRRIACVIVGNVALSGLLDNVESSSKAELFSSLIRLVNTVGTETKFGMQLKREAMRAIGAVQPIVAPSQGNDIAKKTLLACAASKDVKLSKLATDAAIAYGFIQE